MASVIKAADRNAAIHPVAFNFNDIAGEANVRLDGFRAEAAAILEAARREADVIRKQAASDGLRKAEAGVRAELAAEHAKQMATLLPALRGVIEDIRHAKQAWLSHWEKSAVRVATAIAQRVIRRELTASPEITLTLVREALELSVGSDEVRLHLNPDDHQALGPQIESLIRELSRLSTPRVVANPDISPGGCRVETQFGSIDQRFESQLERIEEELS